MTKTVLGVLIVGSMLSGGNGLLAQTPDPAKAAAGKAVFEETKCTKCHGPEGRGDRAGKLSLVGVSSKVSTADIRKWITSPAEMTAKLPRKPKEPMKKFDLTDTQVDQLIAYVESLKK